MVNKLDWYIIRKFLGTFVFMVLIILAVTVVIDIAEKLDDFLDRRPPIDRLIIDYYLNFCLFFGNLLAPICIFLSVIFFTSRMTANTEIVAMLSGGVSFYRILRTYMLTALFLAGISFVLNAYIVPVATKKRIDFEYKFIKKQIASWERDIHKKIAEDPKTGQETFVYLYSFNQLNNTGILFTLEVMQDGDLKRRIDAESIQWVDSTRSWRLISPKIHNFYDRKEVIQRKPSMDTTLLLTPDDIFIKDLKAESMPLNEIKKGIELESVRGSGLDKELTMEYYRRFAYPFAAIILTLIGFSVSTQKRRGGTPLQIGIGLVIAFAYVLLVVAGQAIIGDKLPAWIAVWLPNFVFFGVAFFLLRIAPK